MPKLPAVSGQELVRALRKAGFRIVRQKGNHVTLRSDRFHTVVPLYDDLSRGTLRTILKQCGLSQDDLIRLLHK